MLILPSPPQLRFFRWHEAGSRRELESALQSRETLTLFRSQSQSNAAAAASVSAAASSAAAAAGSNSA
jgi:hypothetical protein